MSGETESKEAIATIWRYLYDMRVLGITFQLYFASNEKMISIQSIGTNRICQCTLRGDICFLIDNVTS